MNRTHLLLILGLLLVGVLCWGTIGADPVREQGGGGGGASRSASERGEDRSTGSAAAESDGRRQTGQGQNGDPRRQAIDGATIHVTGRCVATETQVPLAGCLVEVAAQRPDVRQVGVVGPDANGEDSVSAYTDHEGRFAIEVALHARQTLVLATRLPGRADLRGVLGQATKDIDAGDIEIPVGTRLQARVVGKDGVPVPGVRLRFFHTVSAAPPRFAPVRSVVANSDEQGDLVPAEHLLPGAWNINTNGLVELLKPVGPLQVGKGQTVQHDTFVVRMPDPKGLITGRVLDHEGRGVAHVSVRAMGEGKLPLGFGYADEQGRFQVRSLAQTDKLVRLSVPADQGFEALLTRQTFAWGSKNVVLNLQRAGHIELTVVEAGTGRSVEDYRIVWFQLAQRRNATTVGERGEVEHHPKGQATIEAAPAGTVGIVVVPVDQDLAANDPVEVEKGTGWPDVRIELERRTTLPVRVVYRDGRPVPGTHLELLQAFDDRPITPNSSGRDHSLYLQLIRQKTTPVLLDETQTDAAGKAKLRWRPSGRSLAIRAMGPGHLPAVREGILVRKDSGPVEIVVDSGAKISGLVGPLAVLREIGLGKNAAGPRGQVPTVVLEYTGEGGPRGAHRRKAAQLDGDGNFTFRGLHPGTWSATFRTWHLSPDCGVRIGAKELPPLTLREGETRRVEYDVGDMLPATVHGRVFLNGSPACRRRVQLTNLQKPPTLSRYRKGTTILSTDGDGAFVATGLYPGRYRLSILDERSGASRLADLHCPMILELQPGSRKSETFRIQSGVLSIKITTQGGGPAANVFLDIRHPESGFTTSGRTDAHGRLLFDPIAVGRYVVSTYRPTKSGLHRLGQSPRTSMREHLTRLGEARVAAGPAPSTVEFSSTVK